MTHPSNSKPPFIWRVVRRFWNLVTALRRAVVNLLFLFILIWVIALLVASPEDPLPERGPLFITLSGVLVDQTSYVSPSARLLQDSNKRSETLLRELISTIQRAAKDPAITGLVLQLDYFEGGGISKIQELGEAIAEFRTTAKPVIAFSDTYSQHAYFLASYADEIYLHNLGNVLLTGFGMYRNYFKDALDKIAVNVHVFKVGQYKDFVEPYTRNSMSETSREHNSQWLTQLWQVFTQQIEQQRAIEPDSIDRLINNVNDEIAAVEGDTAQLALRSQLVDFVGTRLEQEDKLIQRFGQGDDGSFVRIPYRAYLKQRPSRPKTPGGNIGLIVASGNILDGWQAPGSIGGDSLSELIRMARQDDTLEALVLRIDSGGGSAFASELIRNELEQTRAEGLPVVVSMGSVAASGGYWIAMGADEVWATPSTLTGSIGVFGLLPTLDDTLAKIGIHTDGIGTTAIAGALRLDRPLEPKAALVYQQSVESIYDKFLKIVAESRGTSADEIHKIAQGRVWSGALAEELGLVDRLGFLDDAIARAAELAGVEDAHVKLIEHPKTPQELILEQLLEQAEAAGASGVLAARWQSLPPKAAQLIQQVISTAAPLLPSTVPRFAYAACFDCIAP